MKRKTRYVLLASRGPETVIVSKHGGHMATDAAPGGGSSFAIKLPIAGPPEAEANRT